MTIKELCTKVREAAERATQTEWRMSGGRNGEWDITSPNDDGDWHIAMTFGSVGYGEGEAESNANAEHIIATQPANALALLGRIEELEKALEITAKPTCFACGAIVIEQCRRSDMKACGREHHGGTRAPEPVDDKVAAVLNEFGWLGEDE